VGEEGEVHAFEPHPDNVRRLNENIQINSLSNVIVNPTAVSGSSGKARFNYGNSPFTSSLKRIAEKRDDWHQVETISIDEYVRKLARQKINFVKIDVRGAEDLVLRGMRNTLATYRPTILLEFYLFIFDRAQGAEMFSLLFDQQDYLGRVLFKANRGRYLRVSHHDPIATYDTLMDVAEGGLSAGLLLQPMEVH
jgi:FkbM family methyltransferase